MRFTIKDVAECAEVSIATVSRIINGKDKGFSEATKQRVREVIKNMNYSPNDVARSLVMKKTYILGVVVPDVSSPFFSEVIRGIEETASELGYSILLCNSNDDAKREEKYIHLLKEKGIDGIIYAQVNTAIEKEIQQLEVPIVFLDKAMDKYEYSWICDDGEYGMYRMVRYLIEKGHREIVYFSGNKGWANEPERRNGYRKALLEHGIPFEPDRIFWGSFDFESGHQNVKRLLESKQNFSAIACANDLIAIGAISGLAKRGIKVPSEVSVTGYDDIQMAAYCVPALTTMAQETYDMGKRAVEILIQNISNKVTKGSSEQVRSVLVERDSVREKR